MPTIQNESKNPTNEWERTYRGEENRILKKHKKILECLLNERVFSIEFFEDGNICIFEGCDGYFHHELSKEECMELSNIFKELAEEIKVSE